MLCNTYNLQLVKNLAATGQPYFKINIIQSYQKLIKDFALQKTFKYVRIKIYGWTFLL